jgi:hypothetical protein
LGSALARPAKDGRCWNEGLDTNGAITEDPDYFFWSFEKKVFRGRLAEEAAELNWKARHIKIPKRDPEKWCVEYFFAPDGKFSRYEIVDRERGEHVGSSITIRTKDILITRLRQPCFWR